jgi:hypothetical protein
MGASALSLTARNRLLACLPRNELRKIGAELELVSLKARHMAYEAGKPIEYLYFPVDSVISIVA